MPWWKFWESDDDVGDASGLPLDLSDPYESFDWDNGVPDDDYHLSADLDPSWNDVYGLD
jgi:hypothetical protein